VFIQFKDIDSASVQYAHAFVKHFREMPGKWFYGTELYPIWLQANKLSSVELVDALLACETGLKQFQEKSLGCMKT